MSLVVLDDPTSSPPRTSPIIILPSSSLATNVNAPPAKQGPPAPPLVRGPSALQHHPSARPPKPRAKAKKQFLRVATCAAVVAIVYIEYLGSMALKHSMWGQLHVTQHQTTWFTSSAMTAFVLRDAPAVTIEDEDGDPAAILPPVLAGTSKVLYLDTVPTYRESRQGCVHDTEFLVAQIATSATALHVPEATTYAATTLVLDCTFTGRVDSSIVRVHWMDVQREILVTVTVQSLRAVQPKIQRDELCWLRSTVVTNLTQLRMARLDQDDHVAPLHPPLYAMRLASQVDQDVFSPIHVMQVNDLSWTVQDDDAAMSYEIVGVQGFFWHTPTILGTTIRFMWRLPQDATSLISSLGYVYETTTIHTFAWIQALVVVGVWGRIVVTLFVTCIVVNTKYQATGRLGLPQVFPTVQQTLNFRSVLILGAMACDGFWGLRAVALRHGFTRLYAWPAVDDSTVRANLLTWCMAWIAVVAQRCHVTISPAIVVVVFCTCEACQTWLAWPWAVIDGLVARMYVQNQLHNTCVLAEYSSRLPPSRSNGPALSLGAMWPIVLYDLTWWFVACLSLTLYIVRACMYVSNTARILVSRSDHCHVHNIARLIRMVVKWYTHKIQPSPSSSPQRPPSRAKQRRNAVTPWELVNTAHQLQLAWSALTPAFRTTFLSPERGLLEHVETFVWSPTPPHLLLLNGSSLWCAGWVRLNRCTLVRVHSLPYLVCNLVCRTAWFSIVGAKIEDGRLDGMDVVRLDDMHWHQLLQLSIGHLKVPHAGFRGLHLRKDAAAATRVLANILAKQDSDLKTKESSLNTSVVVPDHGSYKDDFVDDPKDDPLGTSD
ncbi:Aste57867_2069 [Aphanomyces stellatus]|uniref:Aste57867_2069 protein n=1 Tax=Aphanomyces stellatus TaxID=120398 RepID=A0A485K9A1_9STRA|nr:hypothetical protein As57867_002065 [Aphanomyces stellatus]VFT79272.1 Aste57867_2069 [Aphanomyces stellatus]